MFGIGAESLSPHYFLMAPTRETVVIASACDEAIRPSVRVVTTRARYDRLRAKVCKVFHSVVYGVAEEICEALFSVIFPCFGTFFGHLSDRTFYLHTSLGRGTAHRGEQFSVLLLYYRLIGMMEGD